MLARDISYREKNSEILQGLLESSKKITYRKKVTGFGLYKSDFGENKIRGTRKIFEKRIENFLKSGYIKELKITDRRSKGMFTITPLGITYLFQNMKIKEEYQFMSIIKQLQFFMKHHYGKKFDKNRVPDDPLLNLKLIMNQVKTIDNQLLFQTLTDIFKHIEIKSKNDETEVNLIYVLDDKVFINKKNFIIKKDGIYENDLEENICKKNTFEEFDYYVSLFILLSFHHKLVKYFITQNDKEMFEFYDTDLLKEVDEFNSNLVNEILSKFNSLTNIQVNTNKRIEYLTKMNHI